MTVLHEAEAHLQGVTYMAFDRERQSRPRPTLAGRAP